LSPGRHHRLPLVVLGNVITVPALQSIVSTQFHHMYCDLIPQAANTGSFANLPNECLLILLYIQKFNVALLAAQSIRSAVV